MNDDTMHSEIRNRDYVLGRAWGVYKSESLCSMLVVSKVLNPRLCLYNI